MNSSMWSFVAVSGAGVVLLCMLGILMKNPTDRARQIAMNAATGFFAVLIVNTFLTSWGLIFPVNLLSICAAGIFGVPGVALATALFAIL